MRGLSFLVLAVAACTPLNAAVDTTRILERGKDSTGAIVPTLINGEEVNMDLWRYVVKIHSGTSNCSATVVGPRVVMTAAHCGKAGDKVTVTVGKKEYEGELVKSPLYPKQDHDVAVVVLSTSIPKAEVTHYAVVSKEAVKDGDPLYLMGYGCTTEGGKGKPDGKLRGGKTKVVGFSGYDIKSGKYAGTAALCYGDSGGPGFHTDDHEAPRLVSVNSKGNIRDENYTAALYNKESQEFLAEVATQYTVEICGVNGTSETCGDDVEPPPPPPPPPPPGPCDIATKKAILYELGQCFEVPVILPLSE